jgi:hypothetical protein
MLARPFNGLIDNGYVVNDNIYSEWSATMTVEVARFSEGANTPPKLSFVSRQFCYLGICSIPGYDPLLSDFSFSFAIVGLTYTYCCYCYHLDQLLR